ncbi:MAG: hypothetical protein IKU36_07770 [Bacteroidales bacterium]|nr:hypothetical protein [Bacteroidales bacterium]
MEKLLEFVSQHMSDDTTRLILDKGKWPGIDMETAVNCIESRRKLKGKVQEWHENPSLVFPLKLSAEQCSSSATGEYKAKLAERIAGKDRWSLADLTGGLGVDSWFFSKKAEKVLYNEMQTALCEAARHNFKMLEAGNICISNAKAESGSIKDLLDGFSPDIIYMDPARRGEGGKKVFLIEECTPDVLTLKEEIFGICRHMLIKLSPMADISMVCDRLGATCREVHVVTSEGECKELLIWMDREWNEGYSVTAVELPSGYPSKEAAVMTFTPEDERTAHADIADGIGGFLFEPGKSLTKAGAFNMTSMHFQIPKLGKSTHYYTASEDEKAEDLKKYGKVFRILSCQPLDKRSIKEIGKSYHKAEVTARNIPLTSDALRKKLGCSSGGEVHVFGLKSDKEGNLLMVCRRI